MNEHTRNGAYILKAIDYPPECVRFFLDNDYSLLHHIFVAILGRSLQMLRVLLMLILYNSWSTGSEQPPKHWPQGCSFTPSAPYRHGILENSTSLESRSPGLPRPRLQSQWSAGSARRLCLHRGLWMAILRQ